MDDRSFLRESEVKEGGRDAPSYFYDSKAQRVVETPRGGLAVHDRDPALEGGEVAVPGGELGPDSR